MPTITESTTEADPLLEYARDALHAGLRDDAAHALVQARELTPLDARGQYLVARAFAGRTPTFEAETPHEHSTNAAVKIRPGTTDAVVWFVSMVNDHALLALWRVDVRTGLRTAMTVPWPHDVAGPGCGLADVVYSPDGTLIMANADGIHGADGTQLTAFAGVLARPAATMAFAPDGRTLTVIDEGGEATIWDTSLDDRPAAALRALLTPDDTAVED